MGKHKIWRKEAKKARRKRKRQAEAEARAIRDKELQARLEASPSYQKHLIESNYLDQQVELEEERQREITHQKWLKYDQELKQRWIELQARLQKSRSEKERQDQIIREEWEREQQKLAEKRLEIEKQKQLKDEQDKLAEAQIEAYIANGGEVPPSLQVTYETNPGRETCPFFKKTGVCRFSDTCSRNHIKPGLSSILLMPNFYANFGLEHSHQNEYDSDIGLESSDADMYEHFKDFYNDVLPELETCGKISMFRVCRNFEQHLRGNVYVEFELMHNALKAYRLFHGRWYGGKQITSEFVTIPSWKSAICGLAFHNRCPKGRTCNFLHIFLNPGERQFNGGKSSKRKSDQSGLSHSRWSESPELEIRYEESKSRRRDKSSERESKSRRRDKSSERESKSRRRDKSLERRKKSSSSSRRSSRSSRHSPDSYRSNQSSHRKEHRRS